MTQTKANYLAEWLREEVDRYMAPDDDLWNFIAVNLPEAEQAYNSVMDLENYYMEGAPWK